MMILLGLILLIVGAGVGTVAFLGVRGETSTVTLSAFGFSRAAQPLEIFVIGVVAALLLCLGWALVAAALRRRSRARREEREQERIRTVEREAETVRVEHERRLEEAGLRDEDFQRREDEIDRRRGDLDRRGGDLDAREAEVARLEAAYREKVGPSVADVVTGRAEGRVSDGSAHWNDPTAPAAETRPLPRTERDRPS